jgi:hypothetical protein
MNGETILSLEALVEQAEIDAFVEIVGRRIHEVEPTLDLAALDREIVDRGSNRDGY